MNFMGVSAKAGIGAVATVANIPIAAKAAVFENSLRVNILIFSLWRFLSRWDHTNQFKLG